MKNDIILLSWGGIGDAIVCTPTLKALKEKYPQKRLILYSMSKKHIDVFKNNPYVDSLRYLRFKYMWRYPYHLFAYAFNRKLIKYTLLDFQHISPTFIYNKNIKDIVADIFDLKLEENQVKLFLTESEERAAVLRLRSYKKVVLMHIHSRSSANHHWDLANWNELVLQLPDLTFIQLGAADEPPVAGAVDWRGRTSLREAFALIKHADSFIGVDSSLSHVTNAFDVPGIVLFGDSSPVFWGHDNNINIYKQQPCSPCFYTLLKEHCPYDHECMSAITVEEVKKNLLIQLSKSNRNC